MNNEPSSFPQLPQTPPTESAPVVSETLVGGLAVAQLGLSAVLGVVVAVVCGLGWGLLAYFSERIFLQIAILIGLAITWAVFKPFGKLGLLPSIILFIPCIVLTLFSVLFGDFVFYTLIVMREENAPLLDAALLVAQNFIEIESEEGVSSLLFAAGGIALTGFGRARRGRG